MMYVALAVVIAAVVFDVAWTLGEGHALNTVRSALAKVPFSDEVRRAINERLSQP